MVASLDVLQDLGVDWVAIHPYASIRANGTVGFKDYAADTVWLRRPIEEAHARGMKVMIKPHLAYWGSGFSWRGEIDFDDEAEWARFFETYQAWVTRLAAVTHDADAFVVGTELERTVGRDVAWRRVIAAVDAVYEGPTVYAANWDGLDKVAFWDAVDIVGVQAYFPLMQEGHKPTDLALRRGWNRVMNAVRDLSARTGRPVLFTELGYDAVPTAATEPWKGGGWFSGKDEDLQRRCMETALDAVAREPSVIGAFLWKWFPGEAASGDFRMSSPVMRDVIRGAWRTTDEAEAPPG
jgi:hypothetical protein